METICDSLVLLAQEYGVDPKTLSPDATSAELIKVIAGGKAFSASNVTPASPTANTDYWGTKVSAMQADISISNGKVTGTLHELTSGQLVTDWGEGYFLALKFTKNNARITDIKVGLRPSVSSGLVSLDADMDGVFKITNKDEQVFVMIVTDGVLSYEIDLDLSELTLD